MRWKRCLHTFDFGVKQENEEKVNETDNLNCFIFIYVFVMSEYGINDGLASTVSEKFQEMRWDERQFIAAME